MKKILPNEKILFMGPMAPPYTGQSIAFTTVVNNLKNDQSKVIDISNKNGIISGLKLCMNISFQMLFHRFDRIYFTCSRSLKGSVRDLVLLFWARIRDIPVVNHLHGGDFKLFYDQLPSLYKKLVHWCYSGVGTSIVLTEGMKTQFIDFPGMNIAVVTNSYASYLDECPEKKPERNSKQIRVVYLSNIMKTKGILHLLDAFNEIFSEYDNVSLSIAGTPIGDKYHSEAEISKTFYEHYNKIHSLYPDKIQYLGVCSGESKKQLLWDSDVFILPTFHPTEAFPISILEALRTGNFIVTTQHNYIPEIVSDSNGELIQPDSSQAIINALHKIAGNPQKLTETQNYNIIYSQKKFGEKQYTDSVKKLLYEELT